MPYLAFTEGYRDIANNGHFHNIENNSQKSSLGRGVSVMSSINRSLFLRTALARIDRSCSQVSICLFFGRRYERMILGNLQLSSWVLVQKTPVQWLCRRWPIRSHAFAQRTYRRILPSGNQIDRKSKHYICWDYFLNRGKAAFTALVTASVEASERFVTGM